MFDLMILDYIYIGVILLSTIWASIRGGVYETVATLSWVLAALAARFVSPYLGELFQGWFKLPEPTIGTLVASYFIVFFVILVGFGLVNQRLRDRVQESMMNITDHTFGIIFGIIRGIALMGLVYWALLWWYKDSGIQTCNHLPAWAATARTQPVTLLTATKLQKWFIGGTNDLLDNDNKCQAASSEIFDTLINQKVAAPETPADNAAATDDTGYSSSERDPLANKLLQLENTEL